MRSILVPLVLSSAAFAQAGATAEKSNDAAPPAATESRAPRASFTLYGEHDFSSDFKGGPGSASVTRLFGNLGVEVPIAQSGTVSLGVGSEYETYDFKDATGFAPGFSEPWDHVLRYRFDASYAHQIDRQWRWFVGADVQSAGEIGAEWNKTLSYGGRGGFTYALSERLVLGAGLFVHSRLEDDAAILPFAIVRWKFADRWSLSTTGRNPASFGFGLELDYQVADDWTIFVAGSYQARDFRLDKDGASPGGIGQHRQIPINIGVAWNASKQVSFTGYVGADVFQQFEIQDPNGNELKKLDAKLAPFIGLQAEFKF